MKHVFALCCTLLLPCHRMAAQDKAPQPNSQPVFIVPSQDYLDEAAAEELSFYPLDFPGERKQLGIYVDSLDHRRILFSTPVARYPDVEKVIVEAIRKKNNEPLTLDEQKKIILGFNRILHPSVFMDARIREAEWDY